MKKLKLNKLFHWLYAFLMLYPILCFFGSIIMWSFNQSFTFESSGPNNFTDFFNQCISSLCLFSTDFDEGTLGNSIFTPVTNLLEFFGFDFTDNTYLSCAIGSLFSHWVIVSLFYLIFDVIMLPINIAHHWIDKGSDRL